MGLFRLEIAVDGKVGWLNGDGSIYPAIAWLEEHGLTFHGERFIVADELSDRFLAQFRNRLTVCPS